MAVVNDRLGDHEADLGRGRGVGAINGIAQVGHLLGEVEPPSREQIDQGLVGGEADRLVLVGQGPLGGRAPQRPAQAGAQGPGVIGRPGIKDGRMDHADGPGGHRRPRGQRPDRLQQLLIPGQDQVVVHRRRVLLKDEQRRRIRHIIRRPLGQGRIGDLTQGRTDTGQPNSHDNQHNDRQPQPHGPAPPCDALSDMTAAEVIQNQLVRANSRLTPP
jgi:hypothetical protein